MTLWIGNGAVLKISMAIERILKINNSWMELLNFQNSFNFHRLELLRTAPLPIHKVIIIAIVLDGMNGIYLYFLNKCPSSGCYWDFKLTISRRQFFYSSKLREFADDNFQLMKIAESSAKG